MYLKTLEKSNYTPNFWCSEEYWKRAGWKEIVDEDAVWINDVDGTPMLPTLVKSTAFVDPTCAYWSGFPELTYGKVLDVNFIYDGISVDGLIGKPWKTTRKNIHKVQRELGMLQVRALDYMIDMSSDKLESLLMTWLEASELEEVYDPEVMVDYVLHGDNRLAVIDEHETCYGILIWDFNHAFINFRYCVVDDIPGLSDYARILFREWHDQFPHEDGIQINDGGCLDRPGLYAYKKRLNPITIHSIRSTQ